MDVGIKRWTNSSGACAVNLKEYQRGKYLPKKLWINPCRKKLDKGHCVDDID